MSRRRLFPLAAAALLGGCAALGPDRSAELLDAWHACIVSAVARMDDGRTDPMSIAYGIAPQCEGQYQQVVNEQTRQMITDNSQAAQRQFVQSQELRLITAAILAHRAKPTG